MFNVLITDKLAAEGIELLEKAEDVRVEVQTDLRLPQLLSIIPQFDALLVRSETKVVREVLEAGVKLKVVGRAGVGVDNIDVEAATERGIIVVNAPEGNTIAATEHTIGLMLALARNIPQACSCLREGVWERKKFMGVELRGKVLGIVGLGRIGSEVAKRAQAMEMKIKAYDPLVSKERAQRMGIEATTLESLLREADFISVHLPVTKETLHLLGEKEFALMKPGVRVLNVARGGIIDEHALYQALVDGRVAGAAIDVFESEPCTGSPLFSLANVVVTPHLGASTAEAQVNVTMDVVQEVLRMKAGQPVLNAVNLPPVRPEMLSQMEPYRRLIQRMGSLLGQIVEGRVERVEVKYNGECADLEIELLTNVLLQGFLAAKLAGNVNYVNAPVLARSRGIKVYESKSHELEDYANLISVAVAGENGGKSLAGTVFGNGETHLVRIDGYSIDVVPEGHMLIIPHMDRPRIIGPAASLIGDCNVNIAGMQVGRKVIGGKAVMVLAIDAAVSPETLSDLAGLEGILDVKYAYVS